MSGSCCGDKYESQRMAVATIVYNARDELRRLYESLPEPEQGGPQFWFVIDGPFMDIINKEQYSKSTDGTVDLIESFQEQQAKLDYGIHVVYDHAPYREIIKRNRYLELCRIHKIDWLLIIDSDGFFHKQESNWEDFRGDWLKKVQNNNGGNVWNIPFVISPYGTREWYRRAWFRPQDMSYIRNTHYNYVNVENYHKVVVEKEKGEQFVYQEPTSGDLSYLVAEHNHNLKTHSAMQSRLNYNQYLRQYEAFTQAGASHEDADRLARRDPDKITHDGCLCYKCIEFFDVPLERIFDPRKPEDRAVDVYADIRRKRLLSKG